MAGRTAPLPARPGQTLPDRQAIWSRWAMLARLGVVVAALAVAPVLALTPGGPPPVPERVTLGVTFSPKYAASLGLDPGETFRRLLGELPMSDVRLPLYWDEIERQPGVYDLTAAEAYVAEAARHGVNVVPVLGYKVPRWPECHPPDWARDQGVMEKRAAILNVIRAEVEALRVYPNVARWQVENEPFFPFGDCDGFTVLDETFVAQEVALARQLDARPVLITDSGEFSSGISALRAGDRFGISLYRAIWFEQVGLIRYPLVPEAYVAKDRLARAVAGVEGVSIVSELQAEPWFTSGGSISDVPLDRQLAMFPPGTLREHVRFARQTGATTIYLWGVEWWYWMDRQGYPQYVETMRELIEEVGQR